MPYYRIIIWTTKRRKPFTGIRLIENQNITAVQGITEKKAHDFYQTNVIDVEVQMLAKTSTAVKKFMERKGK